MGRLGNASAWEDADACVCWSGLASPGSCADCSTLFYSQHVRPPQTIAGAPSSSQSAKGELRGGVLFHACTVLASTVSVAPSGCG